MHWREMYREKLISVEKAASAVKSGDRLYLGSTAATPKDVAMALCKRYNELENVQLFAGLCLFPYDFLKGEYKDHIEYTTLFMGPLERMFFSQGNIEPTSYQFARSDWLSKYWVRPDISIIECSPPDENGNMSYGAFAFCTDGMVRASKRVIVQVNSKQPHVTGYQCSVNVKDVDYICEQDHEVPEVPNIPITENEKKIAAHIVDMIDDESTIQIGIGGLANAVGFFLESKKDLGIYTEMLTDSMASLTKKGVVNGSQKTFHPGMIDCAFAAGSKALYEFMDKNDKLFVSPASYILTAENIAANDDFVAINNALTVDLTGQICSESIGFKQYSGTGGLVDLMRGAALSKGGKSFIALNAISETKNGPISRITTALPPGTVVTTPRTDAMYIVTEYGVADLWNKSIPERVKAMISIAHPDFRDQLAKEAREVGLV